MTVKTPDNEVIRANLPKPKLITRKKRKQYELLDLPPASPNKRVKIIENNSQRNDLEVISRYNVQLIREKITNFQPYKNTQYRHIPKNKFSIVKLFQKYYNLFTKVLMNEFSNINDVSDQSAKNAWINCKNLVIYENNEPVLKSLQNLGCSSIYFSTAFSCFINSESSNIFIKENLKPNLTNIFRDIIETANTEIDELLKLSAIANINFFISSDNRASVKDVLRAYIRYSLSEGKSMLTPIVYSRTTGSGHFILARISKKAKDSYSSIFLDIFNAQRTDKTIKLSTFNFGNNQFSKYKTPSNFRILTSYSEELIIKKITTIMQLNNPFVSTKKVEKLKSKTKICVEEESLLTSYIYNKLRNGDAFIHGFTKSPFSSIIYTEGQNCIPVAFRMYLNSLFEDKLKNHQNISSEEKKLLKGNLTDYFKQFSLYVAQK